MAMRCFMAAALATVGLGLNASAQPLLPLAPNTPYVINSSNNAVYYVLDQATWTLAQRAAEERRANLVTINDASENAFVLNNVLFAPTINATGWIGLNDVETEGTFVWASGDPATYRNWNTGEPSGSEFGNEDFVQMLDTPGLEGLWNDINAGFAAFGFVEVNTSLPPLGPCAANFDSGDLPQLLDQASIVQVFDDVPPVDREVLLNVQFSASAGFSPGEGIGVVVNGVDVGFYSPAVAGLGDCDAAYATFTVSPSVLNAGGGTVTVEVLNSTFPSICPVGFTRVHFTASYSDIFAGVSDCNTNGIDDACEATSAPAGVSFDSGTFPSPNISTGAAVRSFFGLPRLTQPLPIVIEANGGDLGLSIEYIEVLANGVYVGRVFENFQGGDCAEGVQRRVLRIPASAVTFGAGQLDIALVPTGAVGSFCDVATIRVRTLDPVADQLSDANGDGVLDNCQVSGCAGDIDGDGDTDLDDFSRLAIDFGCTSTP